jgi:hypothetical protein
MIISRRFENMEGKKINNFDDVKVRRMNSIIEVMHLKNESPGGLYNVVKLNKDEYMIVDTGEVRKYKKSENRGQNVEGLKKTFKKIRDLINNNFAGASNELHITLTYAENMQDTKKLYKDFDKFMKRFRYRYKDDIDYICVVEPQGRGAWHCHLLIKINGIDKIYIPNDEICSLWGHGFTKTKGLQGIDNIGAYLSAYLADVEMTGETIRDMYMNGYRDIEVKEVEVEGLTKKYIKGGRLHYYPPGMNIYRKSKGIKFPEEQHMKFSDAKKLVGSARPTFTRTVIIRDESTNRVLNEITYQSYNLKRL